MIPEDRLANNRNNTKQKCDEHTQAGNDGNFNGPRHTSLKISK